jgi:acyl-CoA synthetase (AMP-forming)/AMP-acid ligase II
MSLKSRLLDWMGGGEGDFAELSLEVFRHQFVENAAYRNYCVALGKNPENVASWREIPAVPTDVFKLPGVALRCFSESEVIGHFLTSGTTTEAKGKHEFRSLELYEASVLGAWQLLGLPEISRPWLFSQTPDDNPHSSLVRMFEILSGRAVPSGGTWLIDPEGNFRLENFLPQQPAALLGTSIALLRACDETEPRPLPEGSWIFETGGSKGLKKSFTPAEVRARLSAHFGVPELRILNEYGMTELFSQFYKWGDQETHTGPPWVGIRVMDVHTGAPAKPGEVGYLEIIDLANLDTVAAIRTQDLAIAVGEREFILLGRDPEAVARGCSRGVEDLLI